MVSMDDLRKELNSERNKTKSHFEIENLGKEREKMEREIREERNKRKGASGFKVIGNDVKKVGTHLQSAFTLTKPIFKKIGERASELTQDLDRREAEDRAKQRQNKAIKKRGFNNGSFIFRGRY